MINWFMYLLESSACMGLFYLAYHLLLREERYFQWNRTFLIGSLVLSLLLPAFPFSYEGNIWWKPNQLTEQLEEVNATSLEAEGGTKSASNTSNSASEEILEEADLSPSTRTIPSFSIVMVLLILYLIGCLWKFWQFGKQLVGLIRRISTSSHMRQGFFRIIKSPSSSYSFGPYLFISQQASKEDQRWLIAHEQVHARQWHTLDLLFLEMVGIIYWVNPLIQFYRKALIATHEYIVDHQILEQIPKTQDYVELLLAQSLRSAAVPITHTFGHSLIKQRISMMKKTLNPPAYWKLLISFPIVAILLMAFTRPDLKTIKVDPLAQQITNLSEVVEDIRHIRLNLPEKWAQNGKDQLRSIRRVIPYKDRWYVELQYVSRSLGPNMPSKRIHIFDLEGQYLRTIDQNFKILDRLSIDEHRQQLIVSLDKSILTYDLNGIQKGRHSTVTSIKDISFVRGNRYVVESSAPQLRTSKQSLDDNLSSQDAAYKLYLLREDGHVISSAIPLEQEVDKNFMYRKVFSQYASKALFLHNSSARLYEANNDHIYPAYQIDFGQFRASRHFQDSTISPHGYARRLDHLVETDQYISFTYNFQHQQRAVFYAKESGKTLTFIANPVGSIDHRVTAEEKALKVINDIDGSSYRSPISRLGNELVAVGRARNDFLFSEGQNKQVKSFCESLDPEDIVLTLYRVKDM